MGHIYFKTQKYDDAHEMYMLAVELSMKKKNDEAAAEGYMNLGTTLMEQNKYDDAIDVFEKSLESTLKAHGDEHPRIMLAHKKMGLAYERAGNSSEASKHFTIATTLSMSKMTTDNLTNMTNLTLPKIDYNV